MNSPFRLTGPHYRIIGVLVIISISINVAFFISGHFLQISGVFWFSATASLIAQISAKLFRLRINFEIAFGIGLFTLIAIHFIFFPIWIFLGDNEISLGTTTAYCALIFIIGCIQQLMTSLIFIKFGNLGKDS